MARSAIIFSVLAGLVAAQKPGAAPEVHPAIETFKCTQKEGCKKQTNYIVLDSLSHPIHQATNSYGCGDWGSGPNKTACPDEASCAKNCIMEGVSDYSTYGVTTNGTSLRMEMMRKGNVVSPRVYLLAGDKQKYEMLQLTGNEIAFDVDATKLPCGMNSALYLSEMSATGARSELNPGGATYGTGK
jgi:cellulase